MLFGERNIVLFLEEHRMRLLEKLGELSEEIILNTGIDILSQSLADQFMFAVPVLREDEIEIDRRENLPSHLPSTFVVMVSIPFEGDSSLFYMQPSRSGLRNIPATIYNGILRFNIDIDGRMVQNDAESVKQAIADRQQEVKKNLEQLQLDVSEFNAELFNSIRKNIEASRDKILSQKQLIASLGFPLKERNDSVMTFVVPVHRKKLTSLPNTPKAIFSPEPTLSMEDYDHILGLIAKMSVVMERSPKAFSNLDEEALRTIFLIPLNGHFEWQATGETFNFSGKTDIIISMNGGNIFIAELKFWVGRQSLIKALDQLLGYITWRDTKTALVMLNRNKNLTALLPQIPDELKTHSNFVREMGKPFDTAFRFVFSHKDDKMRELIVTVMVIEVPTQP